MGTYQFALAGVLVGGLLTYATARIGQRWTEARRDILKLCNQVSAFYQLEQLYKDELARLESSGRSAKTIMEDMRSRVEHLGEFDRPEMTTGAVNKLRNNWA